MRALAPMGAMALVGALAGCGDGAPAPPAASSAAAAPSAARAAAPSAAPAAPAAAAAPKTCAELKGTGEGTLDEPCKVKSASPAKVKVLDKYEEFSDKAHLCEVTNEGTTPIDWLALAGTYYKDGKLVPVTPKDQKQEYENYHHNGGITVLAPGAKMEWTCGYGKDVEPAGATFEVDVSGWGFPDPKLKVQPDLDGKVWKERPPGGFK